MNVSLPKTLRGRFGLAAGLIFTALALVALGLALALLHLDEQQRRIDAAAALDREIQSLQTAFWELRFLEKEITSGRGQGLERRFSLSMAELKRGMATAARMEGTETFRETFQTLQADLDGYAASFDRLQTARDAQRLKVKAMDSSLQVLIASALLHKGEGVYQLLFALQRLYDGYVLSRSPLRYEAVQLTLENIRQVVGDFGDDQVDRLAGEVAGFADVMERDFEREKEVRAVEARFQGLSEEIVRHLSMVSRGALASFRNTQVAAHEVRSELGLLVPAGVAAALGFLWLVLSHLSRTIVRPLDSITGVVARVREGDLDARTGLDGPGELPGLARDLDHMLGTFQEDFRKLDEYRDNLEHLIEQRVKEYAQAVDRLKDEVARRERGERELRVAKRKAEEASRLKSEFLANMSHEVRTPMNGIVGMVQIMEKDEHDAKRREQLQVIRTSADSLLSVLSDILDLSKIEAGRLTVSPVNFDPEALFKRLCALFEPMAARQGIAFETWLDPELTGRLVADEARLRQIVTNLLSNAFKFTKQGRVEFRMGLLRQPGRTLLQVRVSDTGIGIAKDKQSTVFLPFAQADGGMDRAYGGTGLGLAISSRLVGLLGGEDISMQSEPGRGSSFSFQVPVREAGAQDDTPSTDRAASAVPVGGPGLSRLRVLVAEDSEINQYIIKMALAGMGVSDVVMATNGKQAVEALDKDPKAFDVVLMDVQMPVLDGLAATRLLRERGHTLPVVALTAHAMDSDREKCQEAGMDHYISKPFQLDEVRSVLEGIVNRLGAKDPGGAHEG